MQHRTDLSVHELDDHAIELPGREALSLVNANLALPINASIAANVLSDGAVAASNAQQVAPVSQGMMGATPVPAI